MTWRLLIMGTPTINGTVRMKDIGAGFSKVEFCDEDLCDARISNAFRWDADYKCLLK